MPDVEPDTLEELRVPPRLDKSRVAAVAIGHGVNDGYMAFLAPLLPLLIDRFGLTLTLAGSLASVLSVSSNLFQVPFGFLADKLQRRFFVILGPLLTTLAIGLMGLSPTLYVLVLLLFLGGLGTAAFHPQGAALTGQVGGQRRGFAMSLFSAGGTIGFGLGSIFVIAVVQAVGLHGTWLTMGPGLASVIILYLLAPRARTATHDESHRSAQEAIRPMAGPLFLLWLVVMLRAATVHGFITFIPTLLNQKGLSLMVGGLAIFLFTGPGAIGGIVAGHLSDKISRKAVTIWGLLMAGPLLYAFLNTSHEAALVLLLFAGTLLFSGVPVNIVMAQELVPGKASLVSSLAMGLAWGVGGFCTIGIGALADATSLTVALSLLAITPILAGLLACALPRR